MFQVGEVVIASFPFTSLTGVKRREAASVRRASAWGYAERFCRSIHHERHGNREVTVRHADSDNSSCLAPDGA